MQTFTDALLPLFLALGSVWFAVDLVRKLRTGNAGTRLDTRLPAPAAPAAEPTVPVLAPDHAPPAAHLVAITAAVHHVFKGRARLVTALAVPPMPAAHTAAHAAIDWAREGRRDIFTSHRVR